MTQYRLNSDTYFYFLVKNNTIVWLTTKFAIGHNIAQNLPLLTLKGDLKTQFIISSYS